MTTTEHVHLKPGDDCPECGRKIPKKRADSERGPARARLNVRVPLGEEGVIEQLAIQMVEKYQEAWPMDYAAARDGMGLEVVGSSGWLYRAIVFALYATLMVPELAPVEEGQ